MVRVVVLALGVTMVAGIPPTAAQNAVPCDVHVRHNAPDDVPPAERGLTWGTAYDDLQDALDAATTGQLVCVAQGVYRPTRQVGDTADPRSVSFQVGEVTVFGGFRDDAPYGHEPETSRTVLSGDIGERITSTDNAYHVVRPAAGAQLWHLDIVDGQADSRNRREDHGGAGILFVAPDDGPQRGFSLSHVRLRRNTAIGDGGAVLARGGASNVVITDSEFGTLDEGNTADLGGGVAAFGDLSVERTRFHNNAARTFGGAVYVAGHLAGTNVLATSNGAFEGGAVYAAGTYALTHATMTMNAAVRGGALHAEGDGGIRYSILYSNLGDSITWDGAAPQLTTNIAPLDRGQTDDGGLDDEATEVDPLFTDVLNGDFTLRGGSPAVDAAPAVVAQDIDGRPRPLDASRGEVEGGLADLGAFETVNEAPVAEPDGPFEVPIADPFTIAAEDGVLVNDTDANNDVLTAEVVSQPTKGTVILQGDGGFAYRPDGDENGTDTFTYRASDSRRTSQAVTVTIEIVGLPDDGGPGEEPTPTPPPGPTPVVVTTPDVAYTAPGRTVQVAVLGNDQLADDEGGSLRADEYRVEARKPARGTATVQPSGAIAYTPDDGFSGIDTFDYRVVTRAGTERAQVVVGVGVSGVAVNRPSGATSSIEPNGPAAALPLVVDVTPGTPVQHMAVVNPAVADDGLPGFASYGWSADLHLPSVAAVDPHRVVFSLHPSIVPDGATRMDVTRDGRVVPPCRVQTQAQPDPCVIDRASTSGGGARIAVLTTTGSRWTIGSAAVTRISGQTRIHTAVELSTAAFPTAPAVAIARADHFADALAGGPLATKLGGPLLLTDSAGLSPETAAEIRRLGATEAVLLGGRAALSDTVEERLRGMGLTVRRLGGADRFATAALIGDEVGGERAYVVLGQHADPARDAWPDAVSVAGLAAREGMPLALVASDRLPAPTRSMLAGVASVDVIGGPSAISPDVEAALTQMGIEVDRIAGEDRFATSEAVAERYRETFGPSGTVWLPSGRNWPDALAAGPVVAATGGTLVLTDTSATSQAPGSGSWVERNLDMLDGAVVVGGTVAVPEVVQRNLAATFEVPLGRTTAAVRPAAAGRPGCVPPQQTTPPNDGTDTDDDGISDYHEVVNWGTSPRSADTDGDGLTDRQEIFDLGFDPGTNPTRFNPLVADVAELQVDVTSPPSIELITEEGTSVSTSEMEGYSSSQSIGVTNESSVAIEKGYEIGIEMGIETVAEGKAGLFEWGGVEFAFHANFSASHNFSHTATTAHTLSQETTEAVTSETTRVEEASETATGGVMAVTVDIVNTGHVSMRLEGMAIDVLQDDGTTHAPIVTLQPDTQGNQFPVRTLAPGQRLEGLIFANDEMTVGTTTGLLKDPAGLLFNTSNNEYTVLHNTPQGQQPIASSFLQQSVQANTALVTIDDGDGGFSEYRVATTAVRDEADHPVGVPLCHVMDVVAVDWELDDRGTVHRIGGRVTDPDSDRGWGTLLVQGDTAADVFPVVEDIGEMVVRANDHVRFEFHSDASGDGLGIRNERLAGVRDSNPDADDDSVSNLREFGLPHLVKVVGRAPYLSRSSPLLSDTDADGIADADELVIGTDPRLVDTDGDGLADGGALDRATSPTGLPIPGEVGGDCGPTEDWTGPGCDPRNADSDGDGTTDYGRSFPLADGYDDLLLLGGTNSLAMRVATGGSDGARAPVNLLDVSDTSGPDTVLTALPPHEPGQIKLADGDVDGDGWHDLVIGVRGPVDLVAICANDAAVRPGQDVYGNVFPKCGPDLPAARDNTVVERVLMSRNMDLFVYRGSPGGYLVPRDDEGVPTPTLQFPVAATQQQWDDVRVASGGDLNRDGRDDLVVLKHGYEVYYDGPNYENRLSGEVWYDPGRSPDAGAGLNSCTQRKDGAVFPWGVTGVVNSDHFSWHPNHTFPRNAQEPEPASPSYHGYLVFGQASGQLSSSATFDPDVCPYFQDPRTPDFRLGESRIGASWARDWYWVDPGFRRSEIPDIAMQERTPTSHVEIANVTADPVAQTAVPRDELVVIDDLVSTGDTFNSFVSFLAHVGGRQLADVDTGALPEAARRAVLPAGIETSETEPTVTYLFGDFDGDEKEYDELVRLSPGATAGGAVRFHGPDGRPGTPDILSLDPSFGAAGVADVDDVGGDDLVLLRPDGSSVRLHTYFGDAVDPFDRTGLSPPFSSDAAVLDLMRRFGR